MPEGNWRQQHSPSPKPIASIQPPLSKFYHGPVTGWNSAESSPSHDGLRFSGSHTNLNADGEFIGSALNLNPSHDFAPPLPPRISPSPSTYGSPQLSQGWHSPAPPVPTPSHLASASYTSNSYALAQSYSDAPINPTWDSGPPNMSIWGVNHKPKQPLVHPPVTKPPLPPRHYQDTNQPSSYTSKTLSSRVSTTTIDVPLFLQPATYDSASAPPLPGNPNSLQQGLSQFPLPHDSKQMPPSPPRKIPLDNGEDHKIPKMIPKRPQYDPQHSYDGAQQQTPPKLRRPRFDPQNSHDNANSPPQWQHKDRQPTIPIPQFTSFSVESALPPVHFEQELSLSQTSSYPQSQKSDTDHHHARNQSSISPVGPIEQDAWMAKSKPWDGQAAYIPSPEQNYANPSQHDGLSATATDLSSDVGGKLTPESLQTSNTSYRENEYQASTNRQSQQGDDSFYWHSGRSSSDVDDADSQASSPVVISVEAITDERSSTTNSTIVPREHHDLPIRSTSLSPSMSAPYGASALGLGGPSDWEYFGDYEAEDVDDEELYSRSKTKDTSDTFGVSAELPAHVPLSGTTMEPPSNSILSEILPSPETFSTKPVYPDSLRETLRRSMEAPGADGYSNDTETTVKQSPITLRSISRSLVIPSDASPDLRPDLDEVIRAWSEAPHVGKLGDESPRLERSKDYDKKPEVPTEASLASTPREKILGADDSLNATPTVQPMLASMEPVETPVAHSWGAEEALTAPLDGLPMSQGASEFEPDTHTMIQQEPIANDQIEQIKADIVKDRCSSSSHSIHDFQLQETGRSPNASASVSSPSNTISVEIVGAGTQPTRPQGNSNPTDLEAGINDSFPGQYLQPSPVLESLSVSSENSFVEPDHVKHAESPEPGLQNGMVHTEPEQSEDDSKSSLQEPPLPEPVGDFLENRPATRYEKGPVSMSQQNTQSESSQEPQSKLRSQIVEGLQRRISVEKRETDSDRRASNSNLEDGLRALPLTKTTDTLEDLSTKRRTIEAMGQSATSKAFIISPPHLSPSSPMNKKADDPYADLDPWGKASLNRFAAMLREESRAETNKDKLNIFNVFTSRESRLRVVLYGSEDDLISPHTKLEHEKTVINKPEAVSIDKKNEHSHETSKSNKNESVGSVVQRANSKSLQRSLKALPALPANRDSVIGLPGNALAPLVIQDDASEMDRNSPKDQSITDEAQYSPGGRPIMDQFLVENQSDPRRTIHEITTPDAVAGAKDDLSPSSSAPVTLLKEVETAVAKQPAYAPPKYREPRSEVKNYLANRKSVIRPYATLTQGSLENGSTFGKGLDMSEANTDKVPVPAPTSQYNAISKPKGGDVLGATTQSQASETASEPDLRRFIKADFDPIVTILPSSEAVVPNSNHLDDLRNVMEAVPDDFIFIHQSVVAWDTKAKKQRGEKDRQRHARQIESEQRIDSLFDDHEIGYGDISELEAEFKRSEAARKADEDRSEYQMFVSDVFTLVWTRLHYELDQLIPHYEKYCSLMNDTLAGQDLFEESSQGLALAPTMDLFLTLHQKLEIRYQKAFEAVLERDRRLKKTEISPWYTLSNITKVKQLEKQFQDAEKKAIIEYCQQRDSRAYRLMDVLDHNTLRGVGANQDYMEAIWKAINRIASGRAFASKSGSNEPTAGMEEIEKAQTVTTLLATSSEQIVQTFHVAEMLLNSATYEVSVARAKVSDKMDMASLANLKEARAKEDQKLMRDLEHRLALIREDTRRTNDAIVKLMLFLGVANGSADSVQAVHAGASDPGHEVRIQKALEEAKKRNASKDSGD